MKYSQPDSILVQLPGWLNKYADSYRPVSDVVLRMTFVIEAAQYNVTAQTGGPFAAAVFEIESGKLVSLGVNLVTNQRMSCLHAEIVALTVAQRKLNLYDLGANNMPTHELLTSSEPCTMCDGAILWSGVRRLVTAAQDVDARQVGFDEGPKLPNWREQLEKRGISVITDIQRQQAVRVLSDYASLGGEIYNSRSAE